GVRTVAIRTRSRDLPPRGPVYRSARRERRTETDASRSGRYRRGCPVPATAGRAGSYGHVFRRTVRMSPDRVKVDRVKTGMGAPRRRVDPLPPGAQSGLAPSRRRLWVSRSPGRAVVRYAAGRVLKGYADFDPARPSFRLVPPDDPDADGVEVAVADLKAVFF